MGVELNFSKTLTNTYLGFQVSSPESTPKIKIFSKISYKIKA